MEEEKEKLITSEIPAWQILGQPKTSGNREQDIW